MKRIALILSTLILAACGTTVPTCDPSVQHCHDNGAPGNSVGSIGKGLGATPGKPSNPGKPGKGDGGKPGKGDGKGKGSK